MFAGLFFLIWARYEKSRPKAAENAKIQLCAVCFRVL